MRATWQFAVGERPANQRLWPRPANPRAAARARMVGRRTVGRARAHSIARTRTCRCGRWPGLEFHHAHPAAHVRLRRGVRFVTHASYYILQCIPRRRRHCRSLTEGTNICMEGRQGEAVVRAGLPVGGTYISLASS